jgi:hypothetical protein
MIDEKNRLLHRGTYLGSFLIGENKIQYGQDFSYYRGIPVGRWDVFEMSGVWKLVAPGYGEVSNYGNGALLVSKEGRETLPPEFQPDV